MATPLAYAFFATPIGECALAWGDDGLTGVWLPETRPGGLRRKVALKLANASERRPTGAVAVAVAAMTRLLAGTRVDLGDVTLDLAEVDAFQRRVYVVTRSIPAGRVLSYGEVARRVGADASARAVGRALGANPFPIVVPCHRVVATTGGLGGFSAPGGVAAKGRLLAIEDARADGPPGLFDDTPVAARDPSPG
jgi:methylated-DNA-[protein]-cysteine S-methyltransferase